jgi:predicted signal transduction protein with EAL and GGDEF domain
VGRLGGDEFAILIEDLENEQQAVAMAERLQLALRKPYNLEGTEVNSSASIGITFSSIGYTTPDEVLRDADIAMYRAKAAGRARYALFDSSLRAEIADQLHLETDLRRAIEANQLYLAYQPILDLRTGKVVSFEALARWNHPERGPIAADVFIPIAEESGLIGAITDWVITQACGQLKSWQLRADRYSTIGMHVNVSGSDLSRVSLISHVTTTLLANGLDPARLTLEITESTLMKQLDSALETMTRLREIGVGLSVDDFGTGYSSLSSLSTLPITSLKIDRSFVHDLHGGAQNAEIVQAIVTLGGALGKSVIAEGVESAAQLSHLRKLGCGFAQGYLLARPLAAEVAEALLDSAAPLSDLAALAPVPDTAGLGVANVTIH